MDQPDIPSKFQNDIEAYKAFISNKYPNLISLIGKSIGGRGVFFLVKVKNLVKEDFTSVFENLRTEVFKDIPIDNNAKGLSRNFLIPFDENLLINDEAIFTYDSDKIHKKIDDTEKGAFMCIKQKRTVKKDDIPIIAPNLKLIPIDECFQKMNFKTVVDTQGQPVIDLPIQFIKCFIPKRILDSQKHRIFKSIVNVLVYLNPDLPLDYFHSFIWWVNQRFTCGCQMSRKEMQSVVTYAYKDTKMVGLWETNKKWLRTKWIHFDKNCGYSAPIKMKIARELTSKRHIADTKNIIINAITELENLGIKPSQAKVIRKLDGIRCARTIKKYWKSIDPNIVHQKSAHAGRRQFEEPSSPQGWPLTEVNESQSKLVAELADGVGSETFDSIDRTLNPAYSNSNYPTASQKNLGLLVSPP